MSRSHQLRHAAQVLAHAWALRRAISATTTTNQEDAMVAPSRPLRCLLRLHRWDERENPETQERYEICLLCDAYREHPRAAPGAGAAGMTSGGGW